MKSNMNETPKDKSGWRIPRRVLVALAILATLIAIFYAEEDWHGKHAWKNCKRELEAKGMVLDWEKFIPPPVPDDQNFFKAPRMAGWFIKKPPGYTGPFTNDFADGSLFATLEKYRVKTNSILIADLTIEPPAANFKAAGTNIVFKLDDAWARRHIVELIRDNLGSSTMGAQGFTLMTKPLNQIRPVRLVVQTDKLPALDEIAALFPTIIVPAGLGNLRIEAGVESNSFCVWIDPFPAIPNSAQVYAASDYLEWGNGFKTNFDLIREALKRPYARIDGDYTQPFAMPIPNFVAARFLAQTLASRAQCYFLLGQPEKALSELTLLNETCHFLEGGPTGRPMTLVAAMINVAITGLYVNTIADGLQRHAWQEPQLIALQKQLAEINLAPVIVQAFEIEPAAVCHTLEITSLRKIMSMSSESGNDRSIWQKVKDLKFHKSDLVPCGWVYQNMVLIARLEHRQVEGFDLANDLILPRKLEDLMREMNTVVFQGHARPYNFLAAWAIPNYTKATQTLAHNQTLVNEAQIVCALERYHLAHGEYPETLDALVPQFIEKLPHDIIGGQPLHYRREASWKFLLYSVGWNETDDGGLESPPTQNGWIDYTKGDWTWQYPAK
jgi:hypothetical protein